MIEKTIVVDVRYEVPIGKLQEFAVGVDGFGCFVDLGFLRTSYSFNSSKLSKTRVLQFEAIKNKVIKFLFNNELSTKELFNKIKNKFPLSYKSFSRFLMKMVVSQDLQVRTTHKNGCKNIYCLYKNKNRVEVDE